MSEQPSDNRTEEPTPKRRQKARDDGQIARSNEFTAAVMLLGGATLIATVGGGALGNHMLDAFKLQPGWLLIEPSLPAATGLLRGIVTQTTLALLPLGLGIIACSVAAGLVQSRGVTSWKPLQPKLERISPLAGFKRIFGAEALINLVKSSFKLLVLGIVTYVVLKGALPRFVALADAPAIQMVGALRGSVVRLALTVGLAFMVLGAFDYLVQFHRNEKKLKMTRHEVTQEYKEQEGDPLIKARVRQIARQRARRRMLTQVATADVVITNPTHIAIALKYDVTQAGAPVVVAMGERKLAERIKAIAAKAGVPMVENRPLARALRAACTVGAPIPPAFFIAVAKILAYVYRMRRRMPDAVAAAAAEMSPA